MAGFRCSYLVVISLVLLQFTADGQRLRDTMYKTLYGGGACYRRLNGTHQTGCSSKRGGTVGTVHVVKMSEDVAWVQSPEAQAGPYALVLPLPLFSLHLADQLLANPSNIAGIVVINNGTHEPENFSHESSCPNEYSQVPAKQCSSKVSGSHWNPHGTGLLQRDFPFPMFYLPPERREDVDAIYDCFKRFNDFDYEHQASRSLCALDMNSFMFAAVNTEVCHRRSSQSGSLSPVRLCDPLGDRSLYYSLYPRNQSIFTNDITQLKPENSTESPGSVALVTANLDATSLFQGSSTGSAAMTSVSGLTTLLTTAHLLHIMLPDDPIRQYDKNVLFVALNGESFDYIGSQRLAWDLAKGNFPYGGPPLPANSLGPHLHLGQLSLDPLTTFTPSYGDSRDLKVNEFTSWLQNSNDSVTTTMSRGGALPPSPLHPFLKQLNVSAPGLSSMVLASHGPQFKNQFYQSILDDADNLGYKYQNLSLRSEAGSYIFPDDEVPRDSIQMRLANISTNIARALYHHVTGAAYGGPLTASPFIVDELLHCYLDTSSCLLLNASQTPGAAGPEGAPPLSLYVGVNVWASQASLVAERFAMLLTGSDVGHSKADCHSSPNNTGHVTWMAGFDGAGVCIQYRNNNTDAASPAFLINDYDFASGEFSSWSESVWSSVSLRLLVRPAYSAQAATLGSGMAVAVLSVVLVLMARRHVNSLLNPVTSDPTVSQVDC